MNQAIATWNNYAYYGYYIPVYYSSGIPTAQANYRGSVGFGGQGNYRTAMHEISHWMGTGTTGKWDFHQQWSVWNGTYVSNLRRAYDGPGERQFTCGAHYGPQGANYDSEGVQGPQMVGIIGAYRRDQNLEHGDQTIGIAPGTYQLRHRVVVKMLDSLGATAEGAPVGMTSLVGGVPTDNQLWQIVQTDSFFFKIINKANGRALDNTGAATDGAGIAQWTAAGNFSWNQH